MEEANNNDADVFVYIGEEGPLVPHNVVRVRVHPSVTIIHENAFRGCNKLEEVELCEGLREIGRSAFHMCTNLKKIKLPSTVQVICSDAFSYSQLEKAHLPESLQIIGTDSFAECNLSTLRIPPLVTTISRALLGSCRSMFSVEISEHVTEIDLYSLSCYSMRNVALLPCTIVRADAFCVCKDLHQLFGSAVNVMNALKHRFDNLPIHKMIYYQSYNNITVDQLNEATDIRISQRRSKLDPSGSQQDCLGMTPLHILACSSTDHNVELYKVLVNKYPETLITKDSWGAVPLLYAIWGDAPQEITQFLVESYKSLYPNYELDWEDMLITLGTAISPMNVIQNLLDIQQDNYPEQSIAWDQVFDKVNPPNNVSSYRRNAARKLFRYLVQCSIAERVATIGLKHLRNGIMDEIQKTSINGSMYFDTSALLTDVRSKLAEYEAIYNDLKEATSMVELALWKNKINQLSTEKKRKRVEESDSDLREQCRVGCGADIVIEHMLPYLLPTQTSILDE